VKTKAPSMTDMKGSREEAEMWPFDESGQGRQLVSDCTAFLLGHLAEQIEARRGHVPVWAWLNLVAHGSEEDVLSARRAVVSARSAPGTSLDVSIECWHRARSYLAAEVLNLVDRWGPLAEVQREVLVPLELEFASHPETLQRWCPSDLVKAVTSVLEECSGRREKLRVRSSVAGGTSGCQPGASGD
jgi:hypothetical protein